VRRNLATAALILGCAIGAEAAVAPGAPPPASANVPLQLTNNLVFSRPDGSVVSFPPAIRVWCGKWDADVPTKAIHVEVVPSQPSDDFWWLSAVVADVKRQPRVHFPDTFVWNKPVGAQMFAVDGDNELSSAEEESQGRIVFQHVHCGNRAKIRFWIKAKLGSEFFNGQRLTVRGSFWGVAEQ
jgi:hypothetical protein